MLKFEKDYLQKFDIKEMIISISIYKGGFINRIKAIKSRK